MVEEAVQDGCGGGDVADELAPLFEGSVGGHQGRAHFVAAHDDLEEVFSGLGRQLGDAHVVDDKQVAFEVALHCAFVALVEAVVAQIGEEIEDRAVEHDLSALDQFMANGLREVAFADPGRADQEDVLGFFQESAGGQIVDLATVDAGVEAEVEAVQCALFTEGGGLGATLDLSLFAGVEFVLQEQFEELQVIELVAPCFAQAQVETGGQSAQPELAQGVLQVWIGHVGFWFS